jgi:hypothetical protein
VTTVISGMSILRINSGDPQLEQKHLRRFGEDSYSDTKSAPAVTRRLLVGMTEFVENVAPLALRHIEQ